MTSQISHYAVCQAVTPHASNANNFKAFFASVAGTIIFTDTQGNSSTLTILAGVIYPISTTLITGGTATGIHGLT